MDAITEYSIDDLLRRAHELEASDLHVTPGTAPVVRVRGTLQRLDEFEKLTPDVTRELVYRILSTQQQKTLETKRNVDLAYSLPGVARFRVNAFFQRQAIGAAFRMIPSEIKSLDGARTARTARRLGGEAARSRPRHRARPVPVSRRRSPRCST